MQRIVERLAPDRVRATTTTDEGVSVVDDMMNDEAVEYAQQLISIAGQQTESQQKEK